ncbi:MAG TPA: cupin domain-containing protein [Rhodopila sp.]|nr:cupin domain-containing protein [Rhodopila sp.]
MAAGSKAKPAAAKAAVRPAAPVKPAPTRRPAVRPIVQTPAARRSRTAAAPRKVVPRRLSNNAPQVFTVSHLNQDDFKPDGLRPYAMYRDLGIAAATGRLCQAHVIRFIPPCTDEVRKRHTHKVELQLVYVLQGWIKNEFEGYGEQMMSAGSCWLQPSGVKHTVLDYSPDCELLEIIVPADFPTEEVE